MPVQIESSLAPMHTSRPARHRHGPHAQIGAERHIGNPLRMSRTPLVTAGAAPLLGADTHDVLTRVLGLEASEVERLISERICY